MPELIPAVRAIMEEVRMLTGKEFLFMEKADMVGEQVSVRMALPSNPEHLVVYSPDCGDAINHVIAHECGHILRFYRATPEKRLLPVVTEETLARALNEFRNDIGRIYPRLPYSVGEDLLANQCRQAVREVTTLPPDVMIEKWLAWDYPDLKPYQTRALKKRALEVEDSLEQASASTPLRLYAAIGAMNNAFYHLLDNYTKLSLPRPFKGGDFRRQANELYEMTRVGYRDTLEGDVAMIDRWAIHLGFRDWFVWQGPEPGTGIT